MLQEPVCFIQAWACFFAHADTESPRGHKLRANPTLLIPQ